MITEDVFGLKVKFFRRGFLSRVVLHHIGAEPRHLRNIQNEVVPLLHLRTSSHILRLKGVSLQNEKIL